MGFINDLLSKKPEKTLEQIKAEIELTKVKIELEMEKKKLNDIKPKGLLDGLFSTTKK